MSSEACVPVSDHVPSPLVSGDAEELGKSTGSPHSSYTAAQGFVKRNTGLLLILAAQAFFSLMNVAVKKLHDIDPPVSTFQLILVRMGITLIFSVAYMIFAGVPHPFIGPEGVRYLLCLRGFSGFVGLTGLYYSLQYLSLADATVLTFLIPLAAGIAGSVFLGETFTKKQVSASLVSLIGVILIARPSFLFGVSETNPVTSSRTPEQRLAAVGVALIGVCGSSGAYVTIRGIGKRAHPLHAMVAFSISCVIGSSFGMFIQGTPFIIPTEWVWLSCLLMIGTFGFFAQLLLTMGLQREKVARGMIALYTQIVFATIFQLIFFGTLPSALSATGASIIITAALYVALSKQPEKIRPSVGAEERLEEGQSLNDDDDNEVCNSSQRAQETTALLRPSGSTNRSYA